MIRHLFKSAISGQRSVITLFLVIAVSSALLILINYFTIKTLSAVRAYTSGESHYSKGQKDAARNLIHFIETSDEKFWKEFQEDIAVPLGDSIARAGLMAHSNEELIRQGLMQGLNHPDDLSNLIWLFRNFREISFMKKAIHIWEQADGLVARQRDLGYRVYPQVKAKTLSSIEKLEVITQMNQLTSELTIKERAFANVLGEAARTISSYLFYVNFFLTVVIVSSAGYYASVIIRGLHEKNQALGRTNHELDKFVYSVSHDLRAPITSLKGLISIAREEKDQKEVNRYWDLMMDSLNKQDHFIKDIISHSRNKRTEIVKEEIELIPMLNEILEQLQFMEERTEVETDYATLPQKIKTDGVRLKIILSNILSNAFKYADRAKPFLKIKIKTCLQQQNLVIEISDNGIGINKEDQPLIFDMFFVTSHSNKGTGLGLYIVKETIDRMGGRIGVESTAGEGSKFTVSIPL